MLSNCGAGEDSWESLGQQDIKLVNPKGNQPFLFTGRTDAEAEAPILWPPDAKSWLTGKDTDARKDWGQEEKEITGWDGWMASSTQWTWVWANSGRWWKTGKPGMLRSTGSWRVGHGLVADQQQQRKKQLPWWLSGKESTCQCRRHSRLGFNPWVKKSPWRRKWQPTPAFLPGKSHGQRSWVTVHGVARVRPWLSDQTATETRKNKQRYK